MRPAASVRVVIVGGGASGALVATQLLRRGGEGLDVVTVEPRAQVGLGQAFSATDPWHRLNVPAITMSGLPDDPDHFRRWADVPATSFPSRAVYGRYLGALLAEAVAGSRARYRHDRTLATSLARTPRGFDVGLATGAVLAADAVVVATGNEPPSVPPGLTPLRGHPRFVEDPWSRSALDDIVDGEAVAIVGTGHTALDLAASVLRRGPGCRVIAMSRHGELPRAHEDPWRPRLPVPVFSVEEFMAFEDPLGDAAARIRAYGDDWRRALDSIRPITPALWLALDDGLRRRFVAEWRRTWEIHRSRISAEVIRDVEGWIATGRLEVRAATIERATPQGPSLRIHDRGSGEGLLVDRILLATGPDEHPSANPLLASAIRGGLLREGPLGIGLDADPATCRVRGASDTPGIPLYTLGPLLRGVVWETIAIPEIRVQAAGIATRILAALDD